jgi:putative oxidoreductase
VQPDRESAIARTVYPIFRVVVGFLFVCHGTNSLFGVPHASGGMPAHFLQWPSWWAAAIELVCGLLVVVGLGTRVAALICSGAMAYAYFVVHQKSGALPLQNHGELPAVFSWSFLLIACLGPGAFSLDAVLRRGRRKPAPSAQPAAPDRPMDPAGRHSA